jgi:hypothetical protein
VKYTLLDGTDVEYRVLTPADIFATLTAAHDDARMFGNVIQVAVVNPEEVLGHLASLPDPVGQTALLGTEILLASLRAQDKARW